MHYSHVGAGRPHMAILLSCGRGPEAIVEFGSAWEWPLSGCPKIGMNTLQSLLSWIAAPGSSDSSSRRKSMRNHGMTNPDAAHTCMANHAVASLKQECWCLTYKEETFWPCCGPMRLAGRAFLFARTWTRHRARPGTCCACIESSRHRKCAARHESILPFP